MVFLQKHILIQKQNALIRQKMELLKKQKIDSAIRAQKINSVQNQPKPQNQYHKPKHIYHQPKHQNQYHQFKQNQQSKDTKVEIMLPKSQEEMHNDLLQTVVPSETPKLQEEMHNDLLQTEAPKKFLPKFVILTNC